MIGVTQLLHHSYGHFQQPLRVLFGYLLFWFVMNKKDYLRCSVDGDHTLWVSRFHLASRQVPMVLGKRKKNTAQNVAYSKIEGAMAILKSKKKVQFSN